MGRRVIISSPQWGRRLRGRGVPGATAPVLKSKARGTRRTLPLKYSTNLGTEAEGQWVRSRPCQCNGRNGSHTIGGHGALPAGFGRSLSTGVGSKWAGEGVMALHRPLLPGPPAPAHCSAHQPRSGDAEETVWEPKALIYFFFRSWEQRGQNHFPRGLVVSPTQAKWNHSMEQSGLSQPIISP